MAEVKVGKPVSKGRLDILLKYDGMPRIVIECKAPKVTLCNGEITNEGRKAMEQVHKYARGLRHWQKGQLPNIMSMVTNGKQVIWFDSSEPDFHNALRTAKAKKISDKTLDEVWSIINVKEVRDSDLKKVCKHSTIFDERKAIHESSTHLLSKRVLEWLKKILNDSRVEKEDALAMTLQVLFLTIARDHGILGEEEIDQNLGNWDRLFKKCKKRFNSNVFEIQRPSKIKENTLDEIYQDSKKLDYRLDAIPVKYVGDIYEELLRHLHKGDRNFSTSYYTPDWLVEEIIEKLNPGLNDKIIDPTCGSAGFLTYAFDYVTEDEPFEKSEKYLKKNIFGIDCDPLAVQVSRFALLVSLARKVDGELVGKDHILPMLTDNIMHIDFFEFESKNKFDIALGNPPWGSIDREVRDKIKSSLKEFKSYADKTDVCIYIVEKAFRHLSSRGKMAFLVQRQTLDGKQHENFREWWKGRVEEIWDFKSDKLFRKNQALTAVLFGRPDARKPYKKIDRSKKEKAIQKVEIIGHALGDLFHCVKGAESGCNKVFEEYAKEFPEDIDIKPLAKPHYNGYLNKKKKILFIDPQIPDSSTPSKFKKWIKEKEFTRKGITKKAEQWLKGRSEIVRNTRRSEKQLSWLWVNGYEYYKFDGSQMRIIIPLYLNGERLAAGLDLKGQCISVTSTTVLIPKDSTTKDDIFFALAWLNSKLFAQTEAPSKSKMTGGGGWALNPAYVKNMIVPNVPIEIRSNIIKLAQNGSRSVFSERELNELDLLFENGLQQVKTA